MSRSAWAVPILVERFARRVLSMIETIHDPGGRRGVSVLA